MTRIRDRYGVSVFRQFFEAILQRCITAGLVGGRSVFADATKVESNASTDTLKPRFFVEQHLAHLFPDDPVPLSDPPQAAQFTEQLDDAAREALVRRNQEHRNWIEQHGAPDRTIKRGRYERLADRKASTTDPDATHLAGRNKLGYHTHYVVDGGKARIILSALVTPSEVMENQPVLDLVYQIQFRWQLALKQFTADAAYGTIPIFKALEEAHIRAFIPIAAPARQKGFFSKDRFRYDAERDVYYCPNNAVLRFVHHSYTEDATMYRASPEDCASCPLKGGCTASDEGRTLRRFWGEEYVERARALQSKEVYKRAMRKRAVWIEPLFGEAKQWHGLRRFRLRRLVKVNTEALLIAAGQNIKRLIRERSMGCGVPQAMMVALDTLHSLYSIVLAVLTIQLEDASSSPF